MAKGDDPGEIADAAAQTALLAGARRDAILAQVRGRWGARRSRCGRCWTATMPAISRIAMNGGSIAASRGDGIRAYYTTPHANNGVINVTVAEGAEVTGANAGIYVANAGLDAGEAGTADDILKQTVTVHGMVTGGADAAVHLVGGGRMTVGETGKVYAGSSGRAIWVNDPGRAVIRIDGVVRGGAGAPAAVHLTGGGSVTVGMTGRVEANGAERGIRGDNEPTRVAVLQASRFAGEEGRLTQEGVDDARARLGTVGGDSIREGNDANTVRSRSTRRTWTAAAPATICLWFSIPIPARRRPRTMRCTKSWPSVAPGMKKIRMANVCSRSRR